MNKIRDQILKHTYIDDIHLFHLFPKEIGELSRFQTNKITDSTVKIFNNPLYQVNYLKNSLDDHLHNEITNLLELNFNRRTIKLKLDFLEKINSLNYMSILKEVPLFLLDTYPFFEECHVFEGKYTYSSNSKNITKFNYTKKRFQYFQITSVDGYYNFTLRHNRKTIFKVILKTKTEHTECHLLSEKIYSFLDELNRRRIQIDLERKLEKLEKLLEIVNEGIRKETDLIKFLNLILIPLKEIFNIEIAFISIFSKTSASLLKRQTATFGIDFWQIPKFLILEEGLTSEAIKRGEIVILTKKNRSARVKYDKVLEIKSELLIPIMNGKHPLGIAVLSSANENMFSEEDVKIAESIAYELSNIIALKIYNKSLQKLSFVSNKFVDLESQYDEDLVYNSFAKDIQQILDIPVVCIWKKNFDQERGTHLVLKKSLGHVKDSLESSIILNNEKSISNRVINESENLFKKKNTDYDLNSTYFGHTFKDLANNDEYRHKYFVSRNSLRQCISFPIIVKHKIEGVINIYSRLNTDFSKDETVLIRTIVDKYAMNLLHVRNIWEIADLNSKLVEQSVYSNINAFTLQTVHDVKHEFNSLKTDILTIIPLISKHRLVENEAIINQTNSRAKNLSFLFNQLLLYKSSKPLKLDYYHLVEILDLINDMFAIRLKKIKFDYSSIPNEALILCDNRRMQQVFNNLMINSIFSLEEKDFGILKIWVTCRKADNNWLIDFNDNGQGIIEEYTKRVFDISFTTKGNRGSGFGLAICKDIVENKFSGEIFVVSQPGKKTTFRIKIKGK